GPIAKPQDQIPRITTKEPLRKQELRLTEYGNNDLPAVGITYLTPGESDPDTEALEVIATLLATGDSSRLYHSLVYQQQLVAEVFARADSREDASLFQVGGILSEGKKPVDAEQSMLAEIKKLQNTLVPASELVKAKNQLITNLLIERETNEGKAEA